MVQSRSRRASSRVVLRRESFNKVGSQVRVPDVERAFARKGELGAVIAEFIHLRVIELDDADKPRRAEQPPLQDARTPAVASLAHCRF